MHGISKLITFESFEQPIRILFETNKQTKTKLQTFKTITKETFSLARSFCNILEDVKSKLIVRKNASGAFFYEMETLHLFYERHKYSDLLDWKPKTER